MSEGQSIAAATAAIGGAPAPVLLLDACALLDVVRMPKRTQLNAPGVREARRLCAESSAPARHVWLVVSAIVKREFAAHVESVEKEIVAHVRGIDEGLARILAVLDVLAPGQPTALASQYLGSCGLAGQLRDLATRMVDLALVLDEDEACLRLGRRRVVDDRPPASKGKSEYKDCEIVEHYLALAKALRAAGFAEPCILVSSNTRDYRVLGPTADAAFAAELRTAGLSFVTDIVWARSQSGGHTSWRAR